MLLMSEVPLYTYDGRVGSNDCPSRRVVPRDVSLPFARVSGVLDPTL